MKCQEPGRGKGERDKKNRRGDLLSKASEKYQVGGEKFCRGPFTLERYLNHEGKQSHPQSDKPVGGRGDIFGVEKSKPIETY